MHSKLRLTALIFFIPFTVISQTLRKLSPLPALQENVKVFRFNTNNTAKQKNPLVLFNGIEFKNYFSYLTFFDKDNLINIRIHHPHSDSARAIGAARNGAVLFTMKKKIEWVSVKNILDQYAKDSSISPEQVMLDINGGTTIDAQKIYVDKDIVTGVSLSSDTTSFFNSKAYCRVLFIKLSVDVSEYYNQPSMRIR